MTQVKIPLIKSLDPLATKRGNIPQFIINLSELSYDETVNRDEVRLPMQWDNSKYAGFSNEKPWLPVNPNYKKRNVVDEQKGPDSMLNCYKRFLQLRSKHLALSIGEIELLDIRGKNSQILAYKRSYKNEEFYIYLNFTNKQIEFPNQFKNSSLFISTKSKSTAFQDDTFKLDAYEGIVMQ
jgi:glycosidase